jgi:uncharacterized protein (DUF2141 family)
MKFKAFALLGALMAGAAAMSMAEAQTEPEAPPPAVEPAPEATIPPAGEATPADNMAVVHVIAENVETDQGTVWLALCDTSLSVEGCPFKKSVPATAGFVEVTFEGIPPGKYAVVGYHDANDDNVFNRTLGVPREPYALSGPAGEMLAPGFDDAAIEIKPGTNDVILRLGRLVG